ncbi:MAG: hypothetical protein JSU69_04880, partial [Candidatus Zixiibacteriota bacterium]
KIVHFDRKGIICVFSNCEFVVNHSKHITPYKSKVYTVRRASFPTSILTKIERQVNRIYSILSVYYEWPQFIQN